MQVCPRLFLRLVVGCSSVILLAPGNSVRAGEQQVQAMVEQSWRLVSQNYVDPGFNQLDWHRLGDRLLNRPYDNGPQAYSAIQAALNQLQDPYTRLIEPRHGSNSGQEAGLGLHLSRDRESGYLQVVSAIIASPAHRLGVHPGDLITAIAGQSTRGLSLEDAVDRICGPEGSEVVLQIQRGPQEKVLTATREIITPPDLEFRLVPMHSLQVGYMRLSQFQPESGQQVHHALQKLDERGAEAYILDLRNNPGGQLQSSIEIAQMFIEKGVILSLWGRDGEMEVIETQGEQLTTKPLVVLINQGSASASEVLAAALRDHQRAVLVGTSTFGKGSVQAVHTLADGASLVVTVAYYQTPAGENIDQRGVQPDHLVSLTAAEEATLRQSPEGLGSTADPQFRAAVQILLPGTAVSAAR
ncbi:MAG: S41 family peptidase [Synechococcaceae cyanobacterium SM2_3_1]|nr:S41 family peptidase [Synechococcaceae cyanobacterium SM2_3_1]